MSPDHPPEHVVRALQLSFMGMRFVPLGVAHCAEIHALPVRWLRPANDPKH